MIQILSLVLSAVVILSVATPAVAVPLPASAALGIDVDDSTAASGSVSDPAAPVPAAVVDPTEPNDDFDSAVLLETNRPTTVPLDPNDVDVYAVSTGQSDLGPDPFTVDVERSAGVGTVAVVVYGPDRDQLTYEYLDGAPARLRVTPTVAGTHYVQFVAIAGATGTYQLTVVTDQSPPVPGEPDDDPSLGSLVERGRTVSGTIDVPADADWYRFVSDGSALQFVFTRPPGGDGRLGVMFYDRDLRQLNNPPADLTSRADLVVTAQPSPGTYYVVVTSTDRSTGDYAVEYVGSPTPPADAGAVWLPTDPAAAAGLESPSANVVAEPPTPTNQYLVTLPALTDLPEGDRDAVVGALKTHAAETQAPAIRALEASGARVVNTFWLANAVVVEVDPQTVGVDPDGVEDWLGRVVPEAETVVANEPVWTLADATTVGGGDAADGAAATRLSAASTATVDSDVTQTDGIRTTYGLAQVRATEVWSEFGTRGAGVTVAVLDTGVDPAHPDIDLYTSDPTDPTYPGGWIQYDPAGRPIPGSVPSDSNGHGTHVSGTVAGGATGGVAIGVAPDVRLLHGGIGIPGTRSVTRAGAIAGMQWATENGADVISMSFGSTVREVPYLLPVRQATAAGVLVVVASGNDGPDVVGSPADVYDAVSVGVAGPMERILPWSSGTVVDTATRWGPAAPPDWPAQFVVPTVSAPGGATLSAKTVDTGYVAFSGTSMAAPHVAGVAALVIASADRDLSPQEVRNALVATARKPSGAPSGVDPRYGAGIVDALAAARLVTSAETPAPTPGIQGSGSLDGVGLRPSDVAVARAELAGRVR